MCEVMSFSPHEACEDFNSSSENPATPWTRADCIEVWEAWMATMYDSRVGGTPIDNDILDNGYPDRVALETVSSALRDRGTPCTVREGKTLDGVGSSTIRHIAAWLYAKEVGCDWITPDFNQGNVTAILQDDEAPRPYCHRTEYIKGFNASAPLELGTEERRCARVTWLTFFHMDQLSILPQGNGRFKTVEVRR